MQSSEQQLLNAWLMKGSQEEGCCNIIGHDVMKCNWCDGLAILIAEQVTEWGGKCALMKCS